MLVRAPRRGRALVAYAPALQIAYVTDGAGTFWGHVEGIETDATPAVDVWVVDGRREPDLGRLKGIPVRDQDVELEQTPFVRASFRSLNDCHGEQGERSRSKQQPERERQVHCAYGTLPTLASAQQYHCLAPRIEAAGHRAESSEATAAAAAAKRRINTHQLPVR